MVEGEALDSGVGGFVDAGLEVGEELGAAVCFAGFRVAGYQDELLFVRV